MPVDEFSNEPDADDQLQLAGDAALDAIKRVLGEDALFSVVISINEGERVGSKMATCLHLAFDVEDEQRAQAAFELQLLHTLASARAIGVELRVVPIMGQG